MNNSFTFDFAAKLAAIQTESTGWLPLGEGIYLHTGNIDAMANG